MYWDAGSSVAVLWFDQIQNQLDGPLTYNRQRQESDIRTEQNRTVLVFLSTETSAWNQCDFIQKHTYISKLAIQNAICKQVTSNLAWKTKNDFYLIVPLNVELSYIDHACKDVY